MRLFIIGALLFCFTAKSQLYKGLKLTKHQRKELKNICKKHTKIHDSISLDYKNKANEIQDKFSKKYYDLHDTYDDKRDSIETVVDIQIANVLDEKQRKIFWERVNKEKAK